MVEHEKSHYFCDFFHQQDLRKVSVQRDSQEA